MSTMQEPAAQTDRTHLQRCLELHQRFYGQLTE